MPVVVSANYRNREDKNWLVRQESDPIDKYELRDRVVVKDFEFRSSGEEEEGWGCVAIAVGEIEESLINGESLIPVLFSPPDGKFYEVGSDKVVTCGSALVLDETGMYYLPA